MTNFFLFGQRDRRAGGHKTSRRKTVSSKLSKIKIKGAKQAREGGPWQISLRNLKLKTMNQAKNVSIQGGGVVPGYLPNLVTKPETETPAEAGTPVTLSES